MKKTIKIIALLAFALPVCGQIQYPRGTNLSVTVHHLPGTNVAGTLFAQPYRDRGFALEANYATTNDASWTNMAFTFQVSCDGSNYTTASPLVWIVPLPNATAARVYTNVPPNVLENVRRIKLVDTHNRSTNHVGLTNLSVWVTP